MSRGRPACHHGLPLSDEWGCPYCEAEQAFDNAYGIDLNFDGSVNLDGPDRGVEHWERAGTVKLADALTEGR